MNKYEIEINDRKSNRKRRKIKWQTKLKKK